MGLADKSCSLEEMDALPPLEDSDFSEFYWTNDTRQSDPSNSQGKISYNDWDRLLFIFWKTIHYMNINTSRIGGSRNLWKMGALSIYIWVLIEKEGGPNLHLFLINMHMKFGGRTLLTTLWVSLCLELGIGGLRELLSILFWLDLWNIFKIINVPIKIILKRFFFHWRKGFRHYILSDTHIDCDSYRYSFDILCTLFRELISKFSMHLCFRLFKELNLEIWICIKSWYFLQSPILHPVNTNQVWCKLQN